MSRKCIDMKKKIVLLVIAILTVCGSMNAIGKNTRLQALVNSYKGREGIEVLNIRRPMLNLLKIAAFYSDGDEDAKAVKEMLKGIKRITIVDYDDAEPQVKSEFSRKVSKILSNEDLLMEAKDDGDHVKIFGILSEDGSILKDFILHNEEDGSLISVIGKIRLDQIDLLMKQADNQ